jgi:hypothetical protein
MEKKERKMTNNGVRGSTRKSKGERKTSLARESAGESREEKWRLGGVLLG